MGPGQLEARFERKRDLVETFTGSLEEVQDRPEELDAGVVLPAPAGEKQEFGTWAFLNGPSTFY